MQKGRLLFQTAFIFAIGFAGMIAFGYSSVSGGASLARTKYHLLAFPTRRWCCHLPFSSFFSSQHIAVPEMSIGGSFADTELAKHGFFADWRVKPENNLCTGSGDDKDQGKVDAFIRFIGNCLRSIPWFKACRERRIVGTMRRWKASLRC